MLTATKLNINFHLCQGGLVDFGLANVQSCCASSEVTNVCKHQTKTCCSESVTSDVPTQKDCCADEEFEITTDDYTKVSQEITDLPILSNFVISFVRIFIVKQEVCYHQTISSHLEYSPPRLTRDIFVLVQSFLL
jgi:hypothetical protein